MLREAKKTEALNLKSLERYQKLELEKSKKNKVVKEVAKGPFVRYQSVAMPLVEEINEESNVNENEVNF
jgi:vacuolar protein sorting-associated protein 72